MNVLLSDEQIREAMHYRDNYEELDTECILIAKMQARHIFNLLNDPCAKHRDMAGIYYRHRKDCPKCWAEIEEKIAEEINK